MIKALVPLAQGCEETEAVAVIDTLRRAGWNVTSAAVGGKTTITASRGVTLIADAKWEELDLLEFDALILPGGAGGTQVLCKDDGVQEALRIFNIKEKWIGAICAAPLALHTAGILKGRRFTCYPGTEKQMSRTDRSDDRVVVDHNLITSQGPGNAIEFALKLIEEIDGPSAAAQVADGMLVQ